MSRHLQICLIVVVALGCGSATCLYSGAGPVDPLSAAAGGGWHPALEIVADLLTVPIPTAGVADVRDAVLVFFTGLLLVIVAAGLWLERSANSSSDATPPIRSPQSRIHRLACPFFWLVVLCVSIVALALLSATTTGTLELAWGWIARFAAGALWAIILARWFTPRMVRATLIAILAVGAVAIVLSFAHRADRGYLYLSWPIGPITLTGALAGCWAAMALTLVGGTLVRRTAPTAAAKRDWSIVLAGLVAAPIAVAALMNTGRRASAIGLVSALVVVIAILLVRRYPLRGVRRGAIVLVLIGVFGVAAYTVREARSADRLRSGPVQVRLTYLEQSWGLIRERPLFGVGPDQFVVAMTQRMAPLRAVSPQVYHGEIDNAAHNEWVQAAVELGLPGAILYLALPIVMALTAIRRLTDKGNTSAGDDTPSLALRAGSDAPSRALRSGSGERAGGASCSACTLALFAGLVAICVTETAGITLRGPIMPIWYWTILGLLTAQCREDVISTAHDRAHDTRSFGWPLATAGAAVLCFLTTGLDLSGAMRPILSTPGTRMNPAARLYAEKVIADHYRIAAEKLKSWREAPSEDALRGATDVWRRMYELLPAYLDTPARYAECLTLAGRNEEARAVLERALREIDPYELAANGLYATLVADPVGRLRCIQRALRSGALDGSLQEILSGALEHRETAEIILDGLPAARAAASGHAGDTSLRDAAVELLRISAFYNARRGDDAAAIADQRLIAHCYRRLEETSHPYRRSHDAETDAWLTLARLIHTHDRANWRAAFEAVRQAERYAIMGIKHESVADPQPEVGYLGGLVAPVEYPDRLYPLWRFSALLHLIAGEERFLDLRIFAGLPPTQWTQRDLHAELARLARQAHADLSEIPAESRPPHYDQLIDMARHYESVESAR